MQKLSKKKFELKCEELGIASKQSMFFKTGFFQKFGCSPFCSVHSIGTAAKSATKLKSSFQTLCQNEKGYIAQSTNILLYLNIDEKFPFLIVQEMMQTLQNHTSEESNIALDVKYQKETEDAIVYVFFEIG